MDHVWSVLCQNVLINEVTRTISLIELIDQIKFAVPPEIQDTKIEGIPVAFTLVTQWRRSQIETPERSRGRIALRGPNGKPLKGNEPNEFEIDTENFLGFRTTMRFQGFPFVGSGYYSILVQLFNKKQWKTMAVVRLEIIRDVVAVNPAPGLSNPS